MINNSVKLYYALSIICFVSSCVYFFKSNEIINAVMWLALGTTFLCVGKKKND